MRWKQVVGAAWILAMVVVLFGVLPWGIVEIQKNDGQKHVQAWFAAGTNSHDDSSTPPACLLLLVLFAMHTEYIHNSFYTVSSSKICTIVCVVGVFVCLAVPMSIWDVAQHLSHWYKPGLQRKIIRILWMVPVYALNSWLALRFIGAGLYLDTARECYEAYVIYNFYVFLLEYLREREDFDLSLTRRKDQPHVFPFCYMT